MFTANSCNEELGSTFGGLMIPACLCVFCRIVDQGPGIQPPRVWPGDVRPGHLLQWVAVSHHHPRAVRSSDSPGRTPPGWSPRCPAPPGRCSAWAGPRPAECSGTDRSHPASRLQENVVKTDLNMGVSLTGCRLSSLARVWDKHCLMLVCPDNFQLLTKISAILFRVVD